MAIKFREVVRIIEDDGWYQVRHRGSHRQFKHKTKTGLVTIAYHSLNDDVPVGTLNSIYKQAQIDR
ncbi:type II toxin-antitoxin system HicA family toxin [Spirosoma aerolatum]|uniref:type II toxin-antitoxin system HicA family toxin n=1 Tax=Spirosoma aerolatum TaxID=1211326 RepID=UPI001FECBCF5|nr:type II toxin-antitoxin system HicA family toxin [Spirosoma aerolatum]